MFSIDDRTQQTGSHGDDEQDDVGQKMMMVEPLYAACQGSDTKSSTLTCFAIEVTILTSRYLLLCMNLACNFDVIYWSTNLWREREGKKTQCEDDKLFGVEKCLLDARDGDEHHSLL